MIQPAENPYPGINAHINSFMQDRGGGWEAFHAKHINDLSDEINAHVPDAYYAVAEKSLQIGVHEWATDLPLDKSTTYPDVAVYRTGAAGNAGEVSPGYAPIMTFHVADVFLEEEIYAKAALIYHVEEGQYPGKAVTRIELLSPANKPGGSYYTQYLVKRQQTLEAGLRLVEIDYLHETPPVLRLIPNYSDRAPNSVPYTIILSDPRPTPQEGPAKVYGFGVDEPMPVLDIPLDGTDTVRLDFGAVYKLTFKNMRVFRFIADYRRDPDRMETYHPVDQERIRQRMAAIANLL